MNIYDYTDDEIMKVLQKTMDMIEQDKDRAVHIYEIMLQKMATDDGNLVVLSQMADRYLEQASRATDNILRLANVMQKLKSARDNKKSGSRNDFKEILDSLDLEGTSPFMQKNAKGEITVGSSKETIVSGAEITPANKPEEKNKIEPEPPDSDKTDKPLREDTDRDIELETDF